MGLFWMLLNSTFGVYFGFAFPEGGISTGNIIYYIFFVISLLGLVWYYRRLWKEKNETDK